MLATTSGLGIPGRRGLKCEVQALGILTPRLGCTTAGLPDSPRSTVRLSESRSFRPIVSMTVVTLPLLSSLQEGHILVI